MDVVPQLLSVQATASVVVEVEVVVRVGVKAMGKVPEAEHWETVTVTVAVDD